MLFSRLEMLRKERQSGTEGDGETAREIAKETDSERQNDRGKAQKKTGRKREKE